MEKLGGSRRNSLDSLISAKLGLFDRMFAGEAELEGVVDGLLDDNFDLGGVLGTQTNENRITSANTTQQSNLNPVKKKVSRKQNSYNRSASPTKHLRGAGATNEGVQRTTSLKKQKSIIKKR